jgi:cytochrome d ubiquinol oxidase subunit I
VDGVLPTFLSASSLSVPQLITSIAVFTLLYGALAVVEVGLIVRAIKKGPFAQHDPVPDGASPEPEPQTA